VEGCFDYLRFGVRAARTALLISRRFLVFFDLEVLFLVFVAIRFAMKVLYTRNYLSATQKRTKTIDSKYPIAGEISFTD